MAISGKKTKKYRTGMQSSWEKIIYSQDSRGECDDKFMLKRDVMESVL